MIKIDQDLCTACGICGTVCPRHIPETLEARGRKMTIVSEARQDLCMGCGHCSAVCPTGAVRVDGLDPDGFSPGVEVGIDDGRLLNLMKQRRSIRRYKDRPVPREVIDRLIEAAHSAPTGTGRFSTGVLVIDDPESLRALSDQIHEMYAGLDKNLKNPVARFFIKRRVGEKKVRTLQDFVMPGMRWYIRWREEGRSDEILRDCKALMLFHSPIHEPVGAENCLIAAFHSVLMAQTLGVGTCFNDLIPPACNRVPGIRELLSLAEDREVSACVTLGYPKYEFKRTPPRRLGEVRYLNPDPADG